MTEKEKKGNSTSLSQLAPILLPIGVLRPCLPVRARRAWRVRGIPLSLDQKKKTQGNCVAIPRVFSSPIHTSSPAKQCSDFLFFKINSSGNHRFRISPARKNEPTTKIRSFCLAL